MTGSNSIRPKHEKLTVSNLKFSLSYIKNKVMKISLRRQGTCHECRRTPQGEGDARKGNVSFPKSCDKAKHLGAGTQTKEVAGRPRLLCLYTASSHRLTEQSGSEGHGEQHWVK